MSLLSYTRERERKCELYAIASVSATDYYIESVDKKICVRPVGWQVIRNAGESTSKGVEIEAVRDPTAQLTLAGSSGRFQEGRLAEALTTWLSR